MDSQDWLATHFEAHRPHLQAVAYRMLGSTSEAHDAVQEAWLRLSRASTDTDEIENPGGWLTTVVSRVCLNMLRTRRTRPEEPLFPPDDPDAARPAGPPAAGTGHDVAPGPAPGGTDAPEDQAVLSESIGVAMLVVLDTLAPAERLAFVLHDMFAVPFDEIAPIVGRSPNAAKMLASRARRRVQAATVPDTNLTRQREVVDAFLAAARGGDFDALLAVLDPDVVLRADRGVVPPGVSREVRGAAAVAKRAAKGRARAARPALVNGEVGVVVAPRGRLLMVLGFTITRGRIVEIDAISDPERLS